MTLLLFVLAGALVVGVIAAVLGAALWIAATVIVVAILAGTAYAVWEASRPGPGT